MAFPSTAPFCNVLLVSWGFGSVGNADIRIYSPPKEVSAIKLPLKDT